MNSAWNISLMLVTSACTGLCGGCQLFRSWFPSSSTMKCDDSTFDATQAAGSNKKPTTKFKNSEKLCECACMRAYERVHEPASSTTAQVKCLSNTRCSLMFVHMLLSAIGNMDSQVEWTGYWVDRSDPSDCHHVNTIQPLLLYYLMKNDLLFFFLNTYFTKRRNL